MPYRYNYNALMGADATNNNFKPLSEVQGTADHTNMATALLEAKGLTAGTAAADAFLASANAAAGDSQVAGFQNLAGLTESDTAVARKDTWGGSDATMGKSWLEAVVAGDETAMAQLGSGSITQQVNELYEQGFGRAADTEGLIYWGGQGQYGGQSIQDIAQHFLASEEATYRTGYHDYYGRDADQAGLDYWMTSGGTEHHGASDTSADFARILQHTGDANEQKETNVRNRLSAELGIHSTDAQRLADTSLHGADGIAGTDDDIFTDASEADVFRMMQSGDLGAQEVADKVHMQTAAQSMGDYGGGVDDPDKAKATGIHRMLANQEMGSVDSTGAWQSDPTTLAKTAADYLPQVTTDEDGNVTESNVWSLLKPGTQDYNQDDVDEVVPDLPDGGDGVDDEDDTNNDIVVNNEDVDYTPDLSSDVEDTSSYGASKAAFDNAAAGIDTPMPDMFIRNSQMMTTGESAKGVRLRRSKKFKTGEAALGTKQLGRELQIKSLNI